MDIACGVGVIQSRVESCETDIHAFIFSLLVLFSGGGKKEGKCSNGRRMVFISCIIGLIDGFPVVVVYRYVLCCAVLYEYCTYCTAQCNAIQVGFFFFLAGWLAGRQDGDET